MNKYPRVAVLLSTYNGEKYVREMMESVITQDYPNLMFYIRDDGSTDATLDIISEYVEKYDNVVYVEDEKHRGYPGCFYALTNKCGDEIKADYYFFADQDDVWLQGKIKRGVCAIRQKEKQIGRDQAIAYYAGYTICDENLNVIGHSSKRDKNISLINAMYEICGLEFTMAVNSAAIKLLSEVKPRKLNARGTWMSMLYSALGTVIIDNYPVALYRRNDGAFTSKQQSGLGLFIWRVKNFLINDAFSEYRDILEEFYDMSHKRLSVEDEKMLRFFAKQHGFTDRLRKVFYPKRLRSKITDEIGVRGAFLVGKL